jgi:hypothetical protein
VDKKFGGLPWWVWGIGAVVGYYLYRRFSASSALAGQAAAGQAVEAQAYANVTGNPYAAASYAGVPAAAPPSQPAPNPLSPGGDTTNANGVTILRSTLPWSGVNPPASANTTPVKVA